MEVKKDATTFTRLPEHTVAATLMHLSLKEKVKFERVCKEWQRILEDKVWKTQKRLSLGKLLTKSSLDLVCSQDSHRMTKSDVYLFNDYDRDDGEDVEAASYCGLIKRCYNLRALSVSSNNSQLLERLVPNISKWCPQLEHLHFEGGWLSVIELLAPLDRQVITCLRLDTDDSEDDVLLALETFPLLKQLITSDDTDLNTYPSLEMIELMGVKSDCFDILSEYTRKDQIKTLIFEGFNGKIGSELEAFPNLRSVLLHWDGNGSDFIWSQSLRLPKTVESLSVRWYSTVDLPSFNRFLESVPNLKAIRLFDKSSRGRLKYGKQYLEVLAQHSFKLEQIEIDFEYLPLGEMNWQSMAQLPGLREVTFTRLRLQDDDVKCLLEACGNLRKLVYFHGSTVTRDVIPHLKAHAERHPQRTFTAVLFADLFVGGWGGEPIERVEGSLRINYRDVPGHVLY